MSNYFRCYRRGCGYFGVVLERSFGENNEQLPRRLRNWSENNKNPGKAIGIQTKTIGIQEKLKEPRQKQLESRKSYRNSGKNNWNPGKAKGIQAKTIGTQEKL